MAVDEGAALHSVADQLRTMSDDKKAKLRARVELALAAVPTTDGGEAALSAASADYFEAVDAYTAATAERLADYGPTNSTSLTEVNGAVNTANQLYNVLNDPVTGLYHQIDVLKATQVGSSEEYQFLQDLRASLGV